MMQVSMMNMMRINPSAPMITAIMADIGGPARSSDVFVVFRIPVAEKYYKLTVLFSGDCLWN